MMSIFVDISREPITISYAGKVAFANFQGLGAQNMAVVMFCISQRPFGCCLFASNSTFSEKEWSFFGNYSQLRFLRTPVEFRGPKKRVVNFVWHLWATFEPVRSLHFKAETKQLISSRYLSKKKASIWLFVAPKMGLLITDVCHISLDSFLLEIN